MMQPTIRHKIWAIKTISKGRALSRVWKDSNLLLYNNKTFSNIVAGPNLAADKLSKEVSELAKERGRLNMKRWKWNWFLFPSEKDHTNKFCATNKNPNQSKKVNKHLDLWLELRKHIQEIINLESVNLWGEWSV